MKPKTSLVLCLAPDAAYGFRVRDGNVECAAIAPWQGPAPTLAHETEALARVLSECVDNPSRMEGVVLLHPWWVHLRRVPMPPAGARERRQMLGVSVERDRELFHNGMLRWDAVPVAQRTGDELAQTLLLEARESTLSPIEQAFASAGVPLARVGVSTLALAASLSDAPRDGVILVPEAGGVHLLLREAGALADAAWMPLPERASKDFAFEARQLRDRIRQWGEPELHVAAGAELRARLAEVFEAAAPLAPPTELALPCPIPEAVRWSLSGALSGRAEENLLADDTADTSTPSQLAVLYTRRTAVPIAVVLLFAIVGLALAGGPLRNGWYRTAVEGTEELFSASLASETNRGILQRYQSERMPALELLNAISVALPDGARLTNLSLSRKGELRLDGVAPKFGDVQELAARLDRGGSFREARPGAMNAQKDGGVSFSLTAKIAVRRAHS